MKVMWNCRSGCCRCLSRWWISRPRTRKHTASYCSLSKPESQSLAITRRRRRRNNSSNNNPSKRRAKRRARCRKTCHSRYSILKSVHVGVFLASSYPRSPNLCPEAVVDCIGKLGYSFSVHAWLPLCVALSQIVKNPDAPSKRWKEDRWLAITWFIQYAKLQVIITWSITASVH